MSNYKSPLRILHTDFSAGECDPLLAMRHDRGFLPSGAMALTNMLVSQGGAVSRRPGTCHLAVFPARARLVAFEFDINERYTVAFLPGEIRIYNPDGTLADSIASTLITATTAWELTSYQKGDIMWIAHPSFQTRRLRRTGLSSFVLQTFGFSTDTNIAVRNQPQLKFEEPDVTLAISDTAIGTGRTLTCSDPIFTASWVGERLRIYNCEIEVTAFVDSTHLTVRVHQEVKAELGIAPLRFTAGTKLVEITHVAHGLATGAEVTLDGATEAFDITAAELNGTYPITVIDADRYEITVTSTDTANESGDGGGPSIHIFTTDPTRAWTEQLWSDRRGWPGAVTLHENRLWLGGATDTPTFMSGSAVGIYNDHNVRDGLDDDSVQGFIAARGRIRHLISGKQLQVFTELEECITETQPGQAITPSNFKVIIQSTYGTGRVVPRPFDGATVFRQRSGKNIREVVYDYNSDSHVASPVSIIASHLIRMPRDMAVLPGTPSRAEQYLFIVNGTDGTGALFHSIRNEKMAAWTPMVHGNGRLDAVCVLGSQVQFSVERNGEYHLERLELDETDTWLDSSVKMSGYTRTSWAIGAVYDGSEVDVMSTGQYLGRFPCVGGSITLPMPVDNIVAGYRYETALIPWPPDKELNDGPITGEKRRIVSATIHFHDSVSCAVNGREILFRNPIYHPDEEPVRHTGKRRVRLLGYGRDPAVSLDQPTPGPLTVLGMVLEVSI